MKSVEDLSSDSYCPLKEENKVGLIVGITIGVTLAIALIALMVYCLIFRKPLNSELEQTYIEIFAKFKDFEQTTIRADREASLIKE